MVCQNNDSLCELVLRLPVDGWNMSFYSIKLDCRIVFTGIILLSFEKEQVRETERGLHTVHHPSPSSSANPPTHLHGCMRSQTHSIIHPNTHIQYAVLWNLVHHLKFISPREVLFCSWLWIKLSLWSQTSWGSDAGSEQKERVSKQHVCHCCHRNKHWCIKVIGLLLTKRQYFTKYYIRLSGTVNMA